MAETILENTIDNSKEAAKVVSKEESDMVSMVALDNLYGLLFKGSSTVFFPFLFYFTTTIPANLTVLSTFTDNENEKMCCMFPGSAYIRKPKTDAIQSKSHQKWKSNTCATVKDKKALNTL